MRGIDLILLMGVALTVGAGLLGGLAAALVLVGLAWGIVILLVLGRVVVAQPVGPSRTQDRAPAPIEAPFRVPLPLILASLGAHWLAAVVLYVSGVGMSLAPDQDLYRLWGELLAAKWSSDTWIDLSLYRGYNEDSLYYYMNGVMHFLTGQDTTLPMSLINGVFATLSSIIVGRLAAGMAGRQAGIIAFCITAFLPTMIVNSSVNMRDAVGWLLLLVVYENGLRLRSSYSTLSAVLLVLGLTGIAAIRPYMMALVVIGLGTAAAMSRLRYLPYAIVVLVLAVAAFGVVGERFGVSTELFSLRSLEQLETHRRSLRFGGSVTSITGDVSTPTGALSYLPKGTLFFLLSPFPWEIRTARQAAVLPDLLLWYFILAFGTVGAVRQLLRQPEVSTIILPSMAVAMAYGLVEGNAGTAYRHRAQVAIVVFAFAGAEIARFLKLTSPEKKLVEQPA